LTCHNCRSECRRFGKRGNRQRYQCHQCRKVFTDARDNTLDGMYLPLDKAEMVLKLLLEGNSISSIVRLTDIHQKTILKLLVLAGERCERIMGRYIRNVKARDIELDEIWSYIGKKEKRVRPEDDQNLGDCYTFVAIERHTKLVLNIAMGKRDKATTNQFVEGVRDALAPGNKFQVTTDGFAPYKTAVPDTLGDCEAYAMLIKVYGNATGDEHRYSPPEVTDTEVVSVVGQPDPERICTSIVERSNLSVRMGTRRFTRLTNAFSKKWENHWAAVTLWYAFYNFCRVHKSLRVTPAMEAKITDHVWNVRELLEAV
jgi:transposase-like protein/IS1 family transposase